MSNLSVITDGADVEWHVTGAAEGGLNIRVRNDRKPASPSFARDASPPRTGWVWIPGRGWQFAATANLARSGTGHELGIEWPWFVLRPGLILLRREHPPMGWTRLGTRQES